MTGINSKSIELYSYRGYYLACFLLLDESIPLNLTITHSSNNMRYITPNSYNLMGVSVNDKPIEMEMYNPGGLDTMVEVFECIGSVNLEATVDY